MATEYKTTNFMGGVSYRLNPLQTMKLVCTSMIRGEAQYYRPSENTKKDATSFLSHFIFPEFYEDSNHFFDKIVEDAFDYDFEGSIQFISKLRNEYFMRLNSNYLLSVAIHHPKRSVFNQLHPTIFRKVIDEVGCLPTDWTTQFKLLKESGKSIPTIWKRAIAHKLENMTAYHASKYIHGSKTENDVKRANLVDLIRITHPKPNSIITELIKTGKVKVLDKEYTWEKLRSMKKSWREINAQIRLPHMALLRNLRNIIEEYALREDADNAIEEIREFVSQLISGVRGGKQFPFRYFNAHKMLQSEEHSYVRIRRKPLTYSEPYSRDDLSESQRNTLRSMRKIVLEGLNKCILESVECLPAIKGYVDCLSDNSGSSRGGFVSEYGTVKVYEIANLSAILTAYRATKGGSVWVFGDRIIEYEVSKTKPILEQLAEVNALGDMVGPCTETGVWLFWEKCIFDKKQLDTVFIYSDMQAGTGELYANDSQRCDLNNIGANIGDNYIDVLKLVSIYRNTVFPKVNVFSVQVAGYDNSVLPDILYRGAILSGWTGKESKLAYEMIELWNQIEEDENK